MSDKIASTGTAADEAAPDGPHERVSTWWAEHAWLGGDSAETGVLIEVTGDRISRIERDVVEAPAGATVLRGITVPGFVNAHSHAFHRALRGHTQAERGSFWTWRERMYAVAARLQPDNYYRLARATFAEMVLAGMTCVGEFHYVHHDVGGVPYPEPSAMGEAIARAARDAGIRLTLLDTCYLAGGFGPGFARDSDAHVPLSEAQSRFGDGTAARWAERATRTRDRVTGDTVRVGAAVHSVRAVPADQLATVAEWAHRHETPIHAHVSEQVAENDDCLRVYGVTPTEHLAAHGVLDCLASAVHATHLTDDDIAAMSARDAFACFCVTTERDLADGLGPAAELVEHGVRLTIGSDSHAVIDPFEETRGIEMTERVASHKRGHFRASELLEAATVHGAASLGWSEAGMLDVGALADFVTIRLDSVRTAGWAPQSLLETVVFAAGAGDVTDVVVGGTPVVASGVHLAIPNLGAELTAAIAAVGA
ncbi:formimidoylglutamate deiminase [Homoserinimonas sp. OAct 916]|uniref:formimidoylglutamate deiminase n=1 Tax=Homoserinimonas sp. OAct 916 TaxID=2211450 RepID=UPI001E3550D4|nr:formimidoylglutamate deiminase [Homoserinimonas sp. OAct 916]